MKVTTIGTGYVGLVTSACLAEVGNDVLCLDIDAAKIALLQGGSMPFFEPGLAELVRRNAAAGRLRFTTDIEQASQHGLIQLIAVGTPADEDGSADLRHVLAAARSIGKYIDSFRVIVTKSTVPVGTTEKVRHAVGEELRARGVDVEFTVASNPEFLKQGAAVEDFMRPDRIIIGCDDEQAVEHLRALYAPFQRNHERLVMMDVKSAELTKYAANAMLASRISFMNELANMAERLGADIEMVRQGIGSDPRIGYQFLYPGCGYGGSCLPKDVQALIKTAEVDAGLSLQVLGAVHAANAAQKHVLAEKVKARFGADLTGRTFALWGLAFKPDTDDMREAPSREVIADLVAAGARVVAYDPVAVEEARRIFCGMSGLSFAASPAEAVAGADALIIVTEWKEFRSPDFAAIKARLKSATIFDGRNLFAPKLVRDLGFEYFAIGR